MRLKQGSCSAFLWVADVGKTIALMSPTNKYSSHVTVLEKTTDQIPSHVYNMRTITVNYFLQ